MKYVALILFLVLALSGCGKAQLDTITGLACPVSPENYSKLVSTYGQTETDSLVAKFCP